MSNEGGLEARFHDPEIPTQKEISIEIEYDPLLRDYYAPIEQIMRVSESTDVVRRLKLFHFAASDFVIGLHPMIEEALQTRTPENLINRFDSSGLSNEPVGEEYYGPDGILAIPGRSWPKGEALKIEDHSQDEDRTEKQ